VLGRQPLEPGLLSAQLLEDSRQLRGQMLLGCGVPLSQELTSVSRPLVGLIYHGFPIGMLAVDRAWIRASPTRRARSRERETDWRR